MKFYLGKAEYRREKERPDTPDSEECFFLLKSDWDDYGSLASFLLEFQDSSNKIHSIGDCKIIHKSELNTELGELFNKLGEDYISLGLDIDYYSKIRDVCGEELAGLALEALNDIAYNPSLAEPFQIKSSFRNCLLRDNSSDKARVYGQKAVQNEVIPDSSSFSYNGLIPKADCSTEINVNFDPNDPVPGRVVGIIGRNAVGKTQYLAQLANDLVTRKYSAERFKQRLDRFGGHRPAYSRIITISYSAFDRFPRPPEKDSNYKYCGLRNQKGKFSKKSTEETYRNNLSRMKELKRDREWSNYMLKILDGDELALSAILNKELEKDFEKSEQDDPSLFSSGQAILVNLVTSILAWIDNNSLIIFDEPETHLHPNAVASLFHTLTSILSKYNSFALLATHSPLIIQEIPTKRVIVFERSGNTTHAQKLHGETFGENISNLTRHIFETHEVPSYYKSTLKKLSKSLDYKEVLELFPEGLSLNAKSYLLSCYQELPDEEAE